MSLQFLLISDTEKGFVTEGENQYLKRIQRFIPFEKVVIPSNKKWNSLPPDKRKTEEGKKILEQVKSNDYLILLDERGKQFSSISFSKQVEQWLANTSGNVIFVIGGAHGFSDDVYQRANQKLSLSTMTFSHQLIRVIFLEQLYRAFTILHGHPYHNE